MKRLFYIIIGLTCTWLPVKSQGILSLDSCRTLALANNKTLLMSNEKVNAAHYQRKAAFTNFLPKISAAGGYIRTSRELSLLSNAQKSTLSGLGTSLGTPLQQAAEAISKIYPQLGGSLAALGESLTGALNNAGTAVVDALGMQEVILSTDQAYWQVVSLANKQRLAESYLALLQKLESDVDKMIAEGVATKADGLSVKVKVNEAEMTLTKVNDGLSLARMLLCQLCGLDLSAPIRLQDETEQDLAPNVVPTRDINMEAVYANRPEIRSLELATNIYRQKINVARADYLPSLALIGGYIATNPSVFNSFENKFKGMWNVGVTLSLPIWHWGEGIYKVKAAKAGARIAQYQLQDAREKIELQVNQSAFQVREAAKKLAMAEKNLEKADENLRYANLGFEEGVIPASNVLEAHTAWLSAQSERIDAQIDVKLTELYLMRATGQLTIEKPIK